MSVPNYNNVKWPFLLTNVGYIHVLSSGIRWPGQFGYNEFLLAKANQEYTGLIEPISELVAIENSKRTLRSMGNFQKSLQWVQDQRKFAI